MGSRVCSVTTPAIVLDIRTRRPIDDRLPGTMRVTLELAGGIRDEFVTLARSFIKEHQHMPGMRMARCFSQGIQPFGNSLTLVSIDMPAEMYEEFRWHLQE